MISESEASDSDGPDNSPESSRQAPLRFECPVNFSRVTTSVEKQSGQDLLTSDCLHSSDQELWVIRAPKDFDPRCLSGQKVKLHKSTTVETETGSKYDLQVTKNTQHLQQEGLSLLLPNEQDGRLATVPLMHGEINIMQSVAVPSVTIPPPAAPLNTQLPEGLRPRFKPFGWREPKPVNRHTFAQRRDSVHSEKKKKKKRKHDIEDIEEVDSSKKRKTEDVETDRLVADSNTSTELEDRVHKKKKKKKEKSEEEATEAAIEDISETPDSKKKKKKKKDKHRESSGDDEQIMIAQEVEDSEETTVSKKKKKKKKKKEEKDD
ncbi:PREDICTED: DNA-directed RNA polymerase I subunit RPA34-like isoform X2 [Branchiostoma belcheri]|uniref:DNA-directed RNA polymerase I subunit RPA34-like isoform X2 n=1 Tax=Branchiostoma belcheri TaxID=7741 RepID=A0A6P4YTL7_BRABE|nr:PREDICTED: DNA-directed RNA polymerase I subunit RPA34-like isoform X2 [Branchiostoma belcheri]